VAATRLDELVEPLSAASELVRGLNQPSGLGVSRVPYLLPLTCDSEGIHRRVIWHAWMDWAPPRPPSNGLTLESMEQDRGDVVQNTRCGRWSRLLAAGASLRANPAPASMEMFGRLQPLSVTPTMRPGQRRPLLVLTDPEGPLPAQTPKRRLRDLFKRTPDEPEPVDLLDTFLGDDSTEGGQR
jgi:hypothetical protein